MSDEKVIIAHELAKSAHKRIDEHSALLATHGTIISNHNGKITGHAGIISSISEAVDKLVTATETNTKAVNTFKGAVWATIAIGGTLGATIVGLLVFISDKMLGLW